MSKVAESQLESQREPTDLERAKMRADAIRAHGNGGDFDEESDRFHIDTTLIPQGWTYEWKTHSVLGQVDEGYEAGLARKGWEPVPRSRHPEYMPPGSTNKIIERDGMILMERPSEFTEEFRRQERQMAKTQVRHKEEQLSLTPSGTLPRDAHPNVAPSIRKGFERMEIPKEI